MHQYARLDFYRGKWHLVTGKQADLVRIWVDLQGALIELAEKEWEIAGAYRNRFPFKKPAKAVVLRVRIDEDDESIEDFT